MFLGTYTPKLDDKGRLTLPAKFRDELAGGLMVTKGQDHSLAVYPREEFAARARKAATVSRTNPEARAFIRNLSKECVVVGSVDFLEIWDKESWAAYQEQTEAAYSAADADEVLAGLL